MCGEHVMEDTEEYPYELPLNKKVKHWKCLCPMHYKMYNDELEKFFFNFDINDQVSPQSTLLSSPSDKKKAVRSRRGKQSTAPPPKNVTATALASPHEKYGTKLPPAAPNKLPPAAPTKPSPAPTQPSPVQTKPSAPPTETSPVPVTKPIACRVSTC